MAKKKKKSIKLNGQMRSFFGGEPFDEGITRVPNETLVALAHHLGVFEGVIAKEQLIKIFRRLWSEERDDHRELILDFFIQNNKRYPNPKPKEKPYEKEEKIDEMLEAFTITPDERRELHAAFMDIRTRKITPEKIAAKIEHIRYVHKREALEKTLEGKFNFDDTFEFYASIRYTIGEESFTKIEVLKTAAMDEKRLQEAPLEVLISEIETLKKQLTEYKQIQTDAFVSSLHLTSHRYLTTQEIVQAIKSAPPSVGNGFFPLPSNVLLRVLSQSIPNLTLIEHGHDVLIEYNQTLTLPYLKEDMEYTLHLQLHHEELTQAIWREEEIIIHEAIDKQAQTDKRLFMDELSHLIDECKEQSKLLSFTEEQLYAIVYEILLPSLSKELHISAKNHRRVLFSFNQRIASELLKRQRQELLARTVRDFKNLFPLARSLRRRLIFHVGPTNSGKTYTAFEHLRKAGTGYYLAPLRLLALEGYESLREKGINASLITGEEQLVDENATHISSTIEMLNFETEVDCCVIDEVQMIGDRDRGWAWANAIIGAPAPQVIMTGSSNALEAITLLAEYLGEPLEVVSFTRMNSLELLKSPTPIDAIEPKTAVIAFTRANALRLKQQLSRTYRTSVIYGNLSPEVRREEARRFREGETDVLVATDAISMGLNLPIKTLLFSRADKFDGQNQRSLSPGEVQQIAGRAGRYGLSEKGYVGAISNDILKVIATQFTRPIETIKIPFNVMANFDHIMLVSTILEEKSLSAIIAFFVENMKFEGPFRAANLESMNEAAAIVDRYDLDMKTKYILSTAPLSTSSLLVMHAFERYAKGLEQRKPIAYIPPQHFGSYAMSMDELQEAEDRIKEISLYLWLSYRMSEFFIDAEKARSFRGDLNRFIETSLQKSHFVPRCKTCGKPLAPQSEFSICQSCFRNLNIAKGHAARESKDPSSRTAKDSKRSFRRGR